MTIIFRQLIDGLYLQTKEWKIDLWLDQCRRKRMAMKKKARVIYLCVNYLKQTILKIDFKDKIVRQLQRNEINFIKCCLLMIYLFKIYIIYRLIESTITYLFHRLQHHMVYALQKRSQVIKQQGLLFVYTNVYMLVKMFDQLIDQALTRSPVKRAHSHTIHQVFTRNNVQHETTFTDDDIGYTGSLFDWETNIQGRKFIVYVQTS